MKDNSQIFIKWMYYQLNSYLKLKIEKNSYYIPFENQSLYIYFKDNHISLNVIDRYGDGLYHFDFDFETYYESCRYFQNMMNYLHAYKKEKYHRILLCCSGGMTTSYFKKKLNQYFVLSNLPYFIEAASISDVPYISQDFEHIYIAPQMAYKLEDLKKLCPKQKIDCIDAGIFASYDCGKFYNILKETL